MLTESRMAADTYKIQGTKVTYTVYSLLVEMGEANGRVVARSQIINQLRWLVKKDWAVFATPDGKPLPGNFGTLSAGITVVLTDAGKTAAQEAIAIRDREWSEANKS